MRWISIFFRVATKIGNCAPQRFGANQNQLHCFEHLLRGLSIGRLIHVHRDIGAVKGNDRRIFPRANQRQQMDGDLAEVNVQKPRVDSFLRRLAMRAARCPKSAMASRAVA